MSGRVPGIDGPPVTAGWRDQLFEPLVTNKTDGSGLGLSTARNLIENLGGTIHYREKPDTGACFVVSFPERVDAARP